MGNIILTDWPKPKHIEAHYRGVETVELIRIRKQIFHQMMTFDVKTAGGYVILFDYRQIEKELNFRNIQLEPL